jgi:hypothetical protein
LHAASFYYYYYYTHIKRTVCMSCFACRPAVFALSSFSTFLFRRNVEDFMEESERDKRMNNNHHLWQKKDSSPKIRFLSTTTTQHKKVEWKTSCCMFLLFVFECGRAKICTPLLLLLHIILIIIGNVKKRTGWLL